MSTQVFSDEETVDKFQSTVIQRLSNQNRIKNLALTKANNLIELLNIELEVEKNSHLQAMRLIEDDLKYKYELEINRLQDKVDILERELRKNQTVRKNTQKGNENRSLTLQRTNSSKSLEKKKKSLNKIYSENDNFFKQVNGSNKKQAYYSHQFYHELLINLEEWKADVVEQLNNLVKEEYEELANILNKIQNSNDEIDQFFSSKKTEKASRERERGNKLIEVIKDQQRTINQMKLYCQQLETTLKSMFGKVQTWCCYESEKHIDVNFNLDDLQNAVLNLVNQRRKEVELKIQAFEIENSQLKYILDSMIKLVKQDKKLKF